MASFCTSLIVLVALSATQSDAAAIGEQCQNNGDCVTAFSYCHSNRCQCRENFGERQNRCIPQKYHCRFGPALLSTNGDAVQCDVTSSIQFPVFDDLRAPRDGWDSDKSYNISSNGHNQSFHQYLPKQLPQQPWQPFPPMGMPFQPGVSTGYPPFEYGQTNPWNSWNPNLEMPGPSFQLPPYPNFPSSFPQQPQQPFGPQLPFPYPTQPMFPGQQPYPPFGSPYPPPPWKPTENPIQLPCHQQSDTCPKDYYCVTYFNNIFSVAAGGRAIRFSGFCCPNPQPACPVGEPLARSDAQCNNCPTDSHFCYTDHKYGTKACCAKACAEGLTFYPDDGQCRAPARLGDQCDRDDQCGYANSKCVNYNGRKRCGCAYGYITVGPVCEVAQCSFRYQQPLVDVYGELTRCGLLTGNAEQCPRGYSCDSRQGLCCGQTYPNLPWLGNQFPHQPWLANGGLCPNSSIPLNDNYGSPTRCYQNSPCPHGYFCSVPSSVCCPVNATNQCPQGLVATGQLCTTGQSLCPFGSSCLRAVSSNSYLCCRGPQGQCPPRYYPVGGGRSCSRNEECIQFAHASCVNGLCCAPTTPLTPADLFDRGMPNRR